MIKKTLPKGVWFQRKALASGEVVRYGYYGRGPGMEALGREGSADFHFRLAEVLRKAPESGKVSHLIWRYRSSNEFKALRPLTKRDYLRQLDKVQMKFGKLRIEAMNAPAISDHIYRWRDKMAEASPRQADYAISVLSAMLKWCVNRGLIGSNRAAGVGDVYKGDRSEKVWTADQETAFMAKASRAYRLAFLMASEAGLSPEDCYVLPKSAVQGNIIVGRREKNGVPFAVPISPVLRAALDEIPANDSTTLLTKDDGQPFDAKGNGFRAGFRAIRQAAGISDRTHKDCRGTFVSRRRALGWTAEETALCTGHKVAGEAGAQGAYAHRQMIAESNAIRLWERSYGPKREHILQTASAN